MKKSYGYIVVLVLIYTISIGKLRAQNGNKSAIIAQLEKLRNIYGSAQGIQTGLTYYYANESSPHKYLDSLKGSLFLNGKSYRLSLDNTEAMANERYSIFLFKDDRIMYLSKPGQNMGTYNPAIVLDSMLAATKGMELKMTDKDHYRTISVLYPPGNAYKSVAFTIDTVTGYLQKSTMIVKTVYMAPAADEQSLKKDGYDEYAIVETRFTTYRKEELPPLFFDEKEFFSKKEKEYIVTEKYKDYKIFLGSPNL